MGDGMGWVDGVDGILLRPVVVVDGVWVSSGGWDGEWRRRR